jgi:hypothetical protein
VDKPAAKKTEVKKAEAKSSWKPAENKSLQPALVKKVTAKTEEKKIVKAGGHKTEEKKSTVKPAVNRAAAAKSADEKARTANKPVVSKPAATKVVKTELKITSKPTVKTEEKKIVKPVVKTPAKAHTSAMPEIKWIKPVTKAAKPKDDKNTKKNK